MLSADFTTELMYRARAALLAFGFLTGCTADTSDAPIQIIATAPNGTTEEWTLDSRNVLQRSITVSTDRCMPDRVIERDAIDATAGAILLSDGRLAVGNGRTQQIIVYDSTFSRSVVMGGTGTGPGELRDLTWFGLGRGDTLLTYDAALRRVSAFRDSFQWSSEVPQIPAADSAVVRGVAGVTTNGAVVLLANRRGAWVEGRHRMPLLVYRWDVHTNHVQLVSRAAGHEVQLEYLGSPNLAILQPLYPKDTFVRVVGDTIWTVDTERIDLSAVSTRDGTIVRGLSTNWEPPVAEPRNYEREMQRIEQRGVPRPRPVRDVLRSRAPTNLPVVAAFEVDSDGNLWLHPRTTESGEPEKWLVLRGDGQPIAHVAAHGVDRITHIRNGRAAVTRRTPDGLLIPCVSEITLHHESTL